MTTETATAAATFNAQTIASQQQEWRSELSLVQAQNARLRSALGGLLKDIKEYGEEATYSARYHNHITAEDIVGWCEATVSNVESDYGFTLAVSK